MAVIYPQLTLDKNTQLLFPRMFGMGWQSLGATLLPATVGSKECVFQMCFLLWRVEKLLGGTIVAPPKNDKGMESVV